MFDVKRINIILLSIVITISVVGIMFPYGFPLYLMTIVMLFMFLVLQEKRFFLTKDLKVLYILVTIYIASILHSQELYRNIIKDLSNVVSLSIFVLSINAIIKNKQDFKTMLNYVAKYVFGSALLVACIGLYKFQRLTMGIKIPKFERGGDYPWGSSLVTDYNFFSLGLLLGLFFGVELFTKTQNTLKKVFYVNSIIIISIAILFSGSRRGLIIFVLILAVFLLRLMLFFYKLLSVRYRKNFIAVLLVVLPIGFYVSTSNLKIQGNIRHYERLFERAETILDQGSGGSSTFSGRTLRWKYGMDVFGDYNIMQMIFGGGFDYIKKFTLEFASHKGGDAEDYPHNIVISHILFSGLLGFSLLLFFFSQVTIMYFKHRKILFNFFFFFIIISFFLLTSGHSVFSLKTYLLVCLLPYVYHRLDKKTT